MHMNGISRWAIWRVFHPGKCAGGVAHLLLCRLARRSDTRTTCGPPTRSISRVRICRDIALDKVHELIQDGEFKFEFYGVDGALVRRLDGVYCYSEDCQLQYDLCCKQQGDSHPANSSTKITISMQIMKTLVTIVCRRIFRPRSPLACFCESNNDPSDISICVVFQIYKPLRNASWRKKTVTWIFSTME